MAADALKHPTIEAERTAKNITMHKTYRSHRCPKWRLRSDASSLIDANGARRRIVMYDASGGEPFEMCAKTRDGIAVWTRRQPGANVKEILAEVTWEGVPRETLWRAVNDLDRYHEFVPFVTHHNVLRREGGHAWAYGVVSAPLVRNCDYTIKIKSTEGGQGAWIATWDMDNAHGPRPKFRHIRLAANRGSWELRRVSASGAHDAVTLVDAPSMRCD